MLCTTGRGLRTGDEDMPLSRELSVDMRAHTFSFWRHELNSAANAHFFSAPARVLSFDVNTVDRSELSEERGPICTAVPTPPHFLSSEVDVVVSIITANDVSTHLERYELFLHSNDLLTELTEKSLSLFFSLLSTLLEQVFHSRVLHLDPRQLSVGCHGPVQRPQSKTLEPLVYSQYMYTRSHPLEVCCKL